MKPTKQCETHHPRRRRAERAAAARERAARCNASRRKAQPAALQARDAAELREDVLGLEPELREQAGVALGIDLVGELLLGLAGLAVVAALAEQVEDLVLGDFHQVSPC